MHLYFLLIFCQSKSFFLSFDFGVKCESCGCEQVLDTHVSDQFWGRRITSKASYVIILLFSSS